MHKRHTFIKKGFQSKKLIKLNLIELLTPSLYQVNYFSFIIKLMQIQNMRIEMMLPIISMNKLDKRVRSNNSIPVISTSFMW